MDSPFFANQWDYPTRKPYYYEPTPKTHATKKVVTVPVQFIGSEKKIDRIDSALKIQKVFRGFLVRKNLRKIATIRSEVIEIEQRLKSEETIEIIKRDGKERLRLNEMLMNLLFKLDSVRGVDNGVRECRKAVIKKAIVLQETIDAIVADNDRENSISGSDYVKQWGTEEKSEKIGEQEAPIIVEVTNTEIHSDNNLDCEKHEVSMLREGNGVDFTRETETLKHERMEEDEHADDNCQNHEVMNQTVSSPLVNGVSGVNNVGEIEAMEHQVTVEEGDNDADVYNQEANGVNYASESETTKPQVTEENMEEDPLLNQHVTEVEEDDDAVECGEESETDSSLDPPPCHQQHDGVVDDVEVQKEEEKEWEERKRSRELLEKMMEDNEKMMAMMAELFERNETQTRLLSSLSQRVEQLERAFVCQRLRRKKNKNGLVC